MPIPLPVLDNRRFDDLVAEAQQRLASHTPELTRVMPGDPASAFIDVFAWLTETIIYRANLIPERQRLAFLNLLQLPLRSATAARGVICIDSQAKNALLPPVLPSGSALKAGKISLSTVGDLQATPLQLTVVGKQPVSTADLTAAGITQAQLLAQYGQPVSAFRPTTFVPGTDALSLSSTLDHALYLALSVPSSLSLTPDAMRTLIAGVTLSIALAPLRTVADDAPASEPAPRRLQWDLIALDSTNHLRVLPLDVADDSSAGGRQGGVVRLRLPRAGATLKPPAQDDPQFAGFGDLPPELPRSVKPEKVVCWLRLTCPDDHLLSLGYIGLNGVDVIAQSWRRDAVVGIGNNAPDQAFQLPDRMIDPASLVVEVEAAEGWKATTRVTHFGGVGRSDLAFTLDAEAGVIRFGDGQRGARIPAGRRVRAAAYRCGGGTNGNLPAGQVKEIASGDARLVIRHEWPLSGGLDGETVAEAERRIPAFLAHRDRAVTSEDFRALAYACPQSRVARAEVSPGLIPNSSPALVRRNVPGAVSVFVMPEAIRAAGSAPKPTVGMLRDVYNHLKARTLIGTELYVLSPEFIPLAVATRVTAQDPSTETETLQAVERAIIDYLWALAPGGPSGNGWPLGRTIVADELRTRVARVPGVLTAGEVALFVPTSGGAWTKLSATTPLTLLDYQLPELIGVSAQRGSGTPSLPASLRHPEDAPHLVPAPVIPEVC